MFIISDSFILVLRKYSKEEYGRINPVISFMVYANIIKEYLQREDWQEYIGIMFAIFEEKIMGDEKNIPLGIYLLKCIQDTAFRVTEIEKKIFLLQCHAYLAMRIISKITIDGRSIRAN